LVAQLGGSPSPAVGWASGVERLVLLLEKQQAESLAADASQAYFCALGEAAERRARMLAEQLRMDLPSLRLTLNAGGGKLKNQLGRAERAGARLTLVLGEAELERDAVQVKSPAFPSGETVPFSALAAYLASQLH
jgi:histidyl-tRNA synthetase